MISLNSNTDTNTNISIDDTVGNPALTSDEAKQRATTALFAVGSIMPDKDYDSVYKDISTGKEGALRTQAAAILDGKKSEKASGMLVDAIKNGDVEGAKAAVNYSSTKTNPDTVFEERYAHNYLSAINIHISDSNKLSGVRDAMQSDPDKAQSIFDKASQKITTDQLLDRESLNTQSVIKSMSTGGYVGNVLKGWIPLRNDIELRGIVEGTNKLTGGLLGNNLEEQSLRFYNLPIEQQEATLKKAREGLDPLQYAKWLQSMRHMSGSDIIADNIGTGLDVSTIPGGKLLLNTVKSVAKSALKEAPAISAATAAGNIREAGRLKTTNNIVSQLKGVANPEELAHEALPNILKQTGEKIADNPGNGGQAIANQLQEQWNQNGDRYLDTIRNTAHVEGIPDVPLIADFDKELARQARDKYRFENTLDAGLSFDNLTKRYNISIHLGQNSSDYFSTQREARAWAEAKQLKDYEVVPVDSKIDYESIKARTPGAFQEDTWGPHYIKIERPLDTTAPFIRDALATTDETKSPNSWLNTLAGNLRTPEETQSAMEMANRKVPEYAASKFIEMFRDFGEPIRQLRGKEERSFFERTVNHIKNTGQWLDGPAQIEDFYQQNFGRIANDRELKAYYSYRFTEEAKAVGREISRYKAAHNRGAVSINVFHPEQQDIKGNRVETGFFNAIPLKEIPWGQGGVLRMSDEYGKEIIYHEGKTDNPKITQEINEAIKMGKLKAYRIDDPDSYPFQGWGNLNRQGGRPQFVVGKNIEERNLSFNKVSTKPEIEHEYEHYIAQADMTREGNTHWYAGDNIIGGHNVREAAQQQSNFWNELHFHLKGGDIPSAMKTAEKLGIPWEDIHSKFKPGRDERGQFTRPIFNMQEPFQVISKDQMLIDTPGNGILDRVDAAGGTFKDTTREGSPVRQSHYNLLQERRDMDGVMNLKNRGTRENPYFEMSPVKYVDPLTTMNRSLRKMVSSLFMDDYKSAAMESYLAEARPYMTEQGQQASRASPMWAFKEPQWLPGMDPALKQTFENRAMSIRQFIGIPSQIDQRLHSVAQSLADSIYSKVNPDAYGPVARNVILTPVWALHLLKDGPDYIRSATFSSVMGLFNPVHFFLWHMNYSTVLGISGPQKAFAGGLGTILHKFAWWTRDPDVLNYMDKMASRMGAFQPGDWSLARGGLDYTGFDNMYHSFSMLPGSLRSTDMFTSAGGKFMDASNIFIRSADRNIRQGAWYTSFKEWREAHPTGIPTNKDWITMQNRADMLVGNMTAASKSNLQRGIFAPATQFMSYTLRMFETFTGKRLSGIERARLLTTYGALFGVPGVGGFFGGPYPLGETIRKWATDNNYIPHDDPVTTVLMEGILSSLAHLISGHDFNIGRRFGQYGIMSEDLLRDKGWWDLIGGASGSQLSNVFASLHPFYNFAMSFIRGDGEFTPQWDHFKQVAKNVNTLNIIDRGVQAVSTGNWLAKNGNTLQEGVDPWAAIFQSVTGTVSKEIEQAQSMNWSREVWEKNWKAAERQALFEFNKGFQALHDNNPDQANEFFQNGRYTLDQASYPHERYPDFVRRAVEQTDYVTRERFEYYKVDKNIPRGQEIQRNETFYKTLRQEGK